MDVRRERGAGVGANGRLGSLREMDYVGPASREWITHILCVSWARRREGAFGGVRGGYRGGRCETGGYDADDAAVGLTENAWIPVRCGVHSQPPGRGRGTVWVSEISPARPILPRRFWISLIKGPVGCSGIVEWAGVRFAC